jgi:hypothetical protein
MRLRTASITTALLVLLGIVSPGSSQEQGYLSQKLLLESTVQQRVTDAVSKILDESQFVVDVKIELAMTPTRQVETVYRTQDGRMVERGVQPSGREDLGAPGTPIPGERSQPSVTNPFPIPGFPDVAADEGPIEAILDEEQPVEDEDFFMGEGDTPTEAVTTDERFAEITEGLPQIRSMAINVILEDGVSPQTIENVRQVALIASRFDRDRGDVLSITTASFKDRRPAGDYAGAAAPITEIQIEQTAQLEEKLREAQARNDELMKEIRQKEVEYLERSEEERKQALSDLAEVQTERAKDLIFLQQQREEQNARLQDALLNQLDEMREDLTSGALPQEEQDILSLQTRSLEDSLSTMRLAFEGERERLQSQIEAALASQEPPPPQGIGAGMSSTLLIILGIILLAAFIIVAVLLATSRSRAQAVPPGMVYPGQMPPPYPRTRRPVPREGPPRAKKKVKPKPPPEESPPPKAEVVEETVKAEPAVEVEAHPVETAKEGAPPESAEAGLAPSHAKEDPEVLRSEVKSIRQSVVSMSVGRPESATKIMSDWLQGEQPKEPVEEEEPTPTDEVDEAEAEEES